jgi:thioredoxin reductase (NADPH)
MDIENNPVAEKYLISANASNSDLPLVVMRDGSYMIDPSLPELAARIGLQHIASEKMYDVLIIGAGPAGLAASVYGSCEGLKTLRSFTL